MLLNLAVALRNHDLCPQAADVSAHAVSLEPDHATPCHYLWLAADAALARRSEDANQKLGKVDLTQLDPYYRCLRHLTCALLRLDDGPPSDLATKYIDALGEVKNAFKTVQHLRRYRALRRYRDRTLWQLALARRGRPALRADALDLVMDDVGVKAGRANFNRSAAQELQDSIEHPARLRAQSGRRCANCSRPG